MLGELSVTPHTLSPLPLPPTPTWGLWQLSTRKILRNSNSPVCKKCWGSPSVGKSHPIWNFLLLEIVSWQEVSSSLENISLLRTPSLGASLAMRNRKGKSLSWFLGEQFSKWGRVNWGTGMGEGRVRLLPGRGQGSWCLIQKLDGHVLLC